MSKKKKQQGPRVWGKLILALETATGVSSVALFEDGVLLAVQDYHANKLHAKLITVMIDRILGDLELKPAQLAAICIAKGPGSYTGLRVGVSVAKGMAMALNIPLLAVGSLEALAWSVADFAQSLSAKIVPMIDARRMEVFCQTFSIDSEGGVKAEAAAEALVVETGAFAELLKEGNVIFLGDGAEKCREILSLSPSAYVMGARLSSATSMGKAAWARYQAEDFEDLVAFEPFYLKDFVTTVSKKKIL